MAQSSAATPDEYLDELEPERRAALGRLREVFRANLPEGFEETMSYGMIAFVVPHSVYPDGYHCNPKLPLPFISLASQKQYLAVYHMGLYADDELMQWFRAAWAERVEGRLDMGKSCIRLRKVDQVPHDLFGELAGRMTPQDWIERYEARVKR